MWYCKEFEHILQEPWIYWLVLSQYIIYIYVLSSCSLIVSGILLMNTLINLNRFDHDDLYVVICKSESSVCACLSLLFPDAHQEFFWINRKSIFLFPLRSLMTTINIIVRKDHPKMKILWYIHYKTLWSRQELHIDTVCSHSKFIGEWR